MATKEELIQIIQEKKEQYWKWWHEISSDNPIEYNEYNIFNNNLTEAQKLSQTLSSIYYDLHTLGAALQSPYRCEQWQIDSANIFLRELEENPTEKPQSHLRYRGYYR